VAGTDDVEPARTGAAGAPCGTPPPKKLRPRSEWLASEVAVPPCSLKSAFALALPLPPSRWEKPCDSYVGIETLGAAWYGCGGV